MKNPNYYADTMSQCRLIHCYDNETANITAHQLITVWNDTDRSARVLWMGIGCLGKTPLMPTDICDKHDIQPATSVSVDINKNGFLYKPMPTIALAMGSDYYVLTNVETNSW